MKKLEALFTIQGGGTPKRSESTYWLNGNIPWVKVGDIETQSIIKRTEEKITDKGLQSIGNRLFKSGSLLLAIYGSPGKVAIAGETLSCNQAILGINTRDNQVISNSYLRYWLLFKSEELKFKGKGATLKNLSADFVKNLTIEVLPIRTQNKIVEVLTKIESLIEKRKRSISILDQLTNSIFLEKFGDPVGNPNGIEITTLDKLGRWQSGGTPPRKISKYFEGDIAWYSSGELNEIFISQSNEHITEEALSRTSAKKVEKGSLLIGMYDTAALKSSITTIEASCNQAIAFAKLDDKRCVSLFVYFAVQLSKKYYLNQRLGARQQNLNVNAIKKIRIPLPDLASQNEFSEKTLQILSIKSKLNNSIDMLERLFNSFLFTYFNDNNYSEKKDIDRYLNDVVLQQEILGKINTQDFQVYEEYQNAKRILFELLESGKSSISQVVDKKKKRIKLQTS